MLQSRSTFSVETGSCTHAPPSSGRRRTTGTNSAPVPVSRSATASSLAAVTRCPRVTSSARTSDAGIT